MQEANCSEPIMSTNLAILAFADSVLLVETRAIFWIVERLHERAETWSERVLGTRSCLVVFLEKETDSILSERLQTMSKMPFTISRLSCFKSSGFGGGGWGRLRSLRNFDNFNYGIETRSV